tara:strand:- start:283 stop:540 length:258 start_codon:yes stop_codon:yes gene_type:complete
MNKIIVLLLALVAVGACSKGHNAANQGLAEFVWVGCHRVIETPKKGAYAYSLFGDLTKGDYFYFKQVNKDGTVDDVITGKPCNET